MECTRHTLQHAVFDARAIRRKAKVTFEKAKDETNVTGRRRRVLKKSKDEAAEIADPVLLYRSLEKHDKLSYQPKCGFDIEQLAWLFPEEMKAYERWNEMHEEYQESQNKAQAETDQDTANPELQADGTLPKKVTATTTTTTLGSHLEERAAIFDFRTTEMRKENYLEFSKIRQGSFLPRGQSQRRSKIEREWEHLTESTQLNGKARNGSWDHMSAVMVRFLHWLGFDPPRPPPPDDETTHALAFLAYDRLGRVVEKAIILHNLSMIETKNSTQERAQQHDPSSPDLRKLNDGVQLSEEDIERAIQDPSIKPKGLYSLDEETKSKGPQPDVQLYFGPGFEQRLELEMEE